MNIAIIPARGGSKRIPKKNIKLFHGLPIIAYAIKVAHESGVFDEVFVSTDDAEIADISRKFGAIVPWMRSKDLSDDHTTTVSVMQDAVIKLESDMKALENVCCIYPATPLLRANFITQGLQMLSNDNWSYVFSGIRTNALPQRLFSLGDSKGVEMLLPKYESVRTQNLDQFYQDAGQFYWGHKNSWKDGLPIFTSKSTILEIPNDLAVDIDTPEDWHYAVTLFDLQTRE
jgi:N-acylneuraminate cytidylyltransferase